jgi:hypothetical protein
MTGGRFGSGGWIGWGRFWGRSEGLALRTEVFDY